eukprot:scaffold1323_cov82-Skeletonema_dohrnii-CCMP3373.AAC.1
MTAKHTLLELRDQRSKPFNCLPHPLALDVGGFSFQTILLSRPKVLPKSGVELSAAGSTG